VTEILPDDFNTLRHRVKSLETRDNIFSDKQDRTLELLHEIRMDMAAGERR